jgi:hypothetical protein
LQFTDKVHALIALGAWGVGLFIATSIAACCLRAGGNAEDEDDAPPRVHVTWGD